jgi:hypothetical protein
MKDVTMDRTATNLKNELWGTLTSLKEGKVSPEQGNSISSQARKILRTIKG